MVPHSLRLPPDPHGRNPSPAPRSPPSQGQGRGARILVARPRFCATVDSALLAEGERGSTRRLVLWGEGGGGVLGGSQNKTKTFTGLYYHPTAPHAHAPRPCLFAEAQVTLVAKYSHSLPFDEKVRLILPFSPLPLLRRIRCGMRGDSGLGKLRKGASVP